MKNNIEVKFGNQYYYLIVDGRIVYKSKNANKVNARYVQMMKIRENREHKIEQFKDNPYKIV